MASPPLIVPAVKKHTATVIFAHGLGDSGAGWMDLAKNWRRRGMYEHIKFIFPNAPAIPITVNFGMSMPGWYDITTFDDLDAKSHDETGIIRSRDYFNTLIKNETEQTSVPTTRMVLGGFSQGGAISLFAALTTPYPMAGFFGMSSYLLLGHKVKSLIPASNPNAGTPIWMGHGDADPLVKYDWGQRTAKALEDFGMKVEFNTYKGLIHSADLREINDLEEFLQQRLPPIAEDGSPGASTSTASASKA